MITVKYSRWVLVFPLIISFFVLVGCNPGGSDYGSQLDISLDVQELTLIQLWQIIVGKIEIQGETARLQSFTIETDEHGEVRMVRYVLWGLNLANQSAVYIVDINNREHRKELSVSSREHYSPIESGHPRVYFTEIDKVGLPNIQSDTDGIRISIDDIFPGGDYRSSIGVNLLFRLKDGNLVPLKRVKFRDEPYIFGVKVDRKARDGEPLYPLEIWFLEQDLTKTEIVEYQ